MKSKYKIIPDVNSNNYIKINSNTALKFNICNLKRGFIRFGITCYEVDFLLSDEIASNEIVVSSKIIEYLRIPLYAEYEIAFKKNELILGPYIGILAAKTEENLDNMVQSLSNYVYSYEQIGGSILAFSINGIDKYNQRINGYVFNPNTGRWIKGVYNYPSSIFKRTGLNNDLRVHFRSLLGNSIFNDYIFNKWEMYQWLSNFKDISKYLPDTFLYTKPSNIISLLNQYGKLYIKPIYGSMGTGILEVIKKGNTYIIRHNHKARKSEDIFRNESQATSFFERELGKYKYIIQQSIDLITFEDKLIDFRLLVLKNYSGEWQESGIVGRYGVKQNIVSNISSGGMAEKGEITLKKVLNLKDDEIVNLKQKMFKIAIDAAKSIEKVGVNCGNLGIDMAIDKSGQIWIIEINNRDPNHIIAITAGDRQMFYKAKLTNMLYAKKLAGF